MKNRLWRKVNNRIRIVESNKGFTVELKDNYRDWHKLRDTKTIKEALLQKHYYVRMVLYKDLGIGVRYKNKSYAK